MKMEIIIKVTSGMERRMVKVNSNMQLQETHILGHLEKIRELVKE